MTNEKIFENAVYCATQNNYIIPNYIDSMTQLLNLSYFDLKDLILYSKDFAKAFFGEKDMTYSKNAWVNRLIEMSKARDEFEYLRKFLNA